MTLSKLGAASAALVTLAGASTAPGAVLAAPRAEAPNDPKALIESLNEAVTELRTKHEEQLKSKVDDVVLTEHIDRITASIDKIEAAQDEQARKLLAASLGGNGGRNIVDQEYSDAFASYFKNNKIEASLNKGADNEGGYLAPEEWDRTITDKLVEVSEMRAICDVQPTSKDSFKKLVNMRGTSSGWVGESAARPETNTPTLEPYSYSIGEMYANPAATQGMLDDSEVDIEAWLAGEIQTEFSLREGQAFISGDGVNKPVGILTYVTGGVNAAAHPLGDIKLVNSGDAATIGDGDAIVALTDELPTAFSGAARFGMSRGTRGKVRLLKDGNGNFLWQPSFQVGTPSTLAGYPISELPDMPAIAADSVPILFGDFKRTYLVLDRIGTRVLRDPYTNKPFVHFYTTKRVGGGLKNPEPMKGLKIAI